MRNRIINIICGIETIILFVLIVHILKGKQIQEVTETSSDLVYNELSAPSRDIQEITTSQKICYLTFDDGPSSNTEKILDILAQYDAKATFFIVGQSLDENSSEILNRMVEEGHAIGLHANEHVYEKLYANMNSFLADYECLYQTLKDDYGIETAIYRFPGGSACSYLNGQGKAYIQNMHKRGFYCFDWNVSGEDAVGNPEVTTIQENVFSDVFRYDTPIVLLHDSNIAAKTVEALPQIMSRIQEEGYIFKSLEHAEEYIFPKNR